MLWVIKVVPTTRLRNLLAKSQQSISSPSSFAANPSSFATNPCEQCALDTETTI